MLDRLKNTGTIISIVSMIVIILTNLGFDVQNNTVMSIVEAICTIGVALGILNNPTTKGLDNPFKK